MPPNSQMYDARARNLQIGELEIWLAETEDGEKIFTPMGVTPRKCNWTGGGSKKSKRSH